MQPEAIDRLCSFWFEHIIGDGFNSEITPEKNQLASAHQAYHLVAADAAKEVVPDDMGFVVGYETGLRVASAVLADPFGDPTQALKDAVARQRAELRTLECDYGPSWERTLTELAGTFDSSRNTGEAQ